MAAATSWAWPPGHRGRSPSPGPPGPGCTDSGHCSSSAKLERQNGKTTQFRQLCTFCKSWRDRMEKQFRQLCTLTFCKSWRDGMEKQHNSNNFVLSAKAGETEWKNNTIQTTLYFLQKLERQNGKTTQFKQLCTFCKSWRDGMEKQHNSDNFVL